MWRPAVPAGKQHYKMRDRSPQSNWEERRLPQKLTANSQRRTLKNWKTGEDTFLRIVFEGTSKNCLNVIARSEATRQSPVIHHKNARFADASTPIVLYAVLVVVLRFARNDKTRF
jgi:hypothetical protein